LSKTIRDVTDSGRSQQPCDFLHKRVLQAARQDHGAIGGGPLNEPQNLETILIRETHGGNDHMRLRSEEKVQSLLAGPGLGNQLEELEAMQLLTKTMANER
jgi:hypothetical protein